MAAEPIQRSAKVIQACRQLNLFLLPDAISVYQNSNLIAICLFFMMYPIT